MIRVSMQLAVMLAAYRAQGGDPYNFVIRVRQDPDKGVSLELKGLPEFGR